MSYEVHAVGKVPEKRLRAMGVAVSSLIALASIKDAQAPKPPVATVKPAERTLSVDPARVTRGRDAASLLMLAGAMMLQASPQEQARVDAFVKRVGREGVARRSVPTFDEQGRATPTVAQTTR